MGLFRHGRRFKVAGSKQSYQNVSAPLPFRFYFMFNWHKMSIIDFLNPHPIPQVLSAPQMLRDRGAVCVAHRLIFSLSILVFH